MIDRRSQATFDAFVDRSLPKAEWTHDAHLTVCWVALADRNPAEALNWLRSNIRVYNEATGVANTATTGYHETITHYFVDAVAALAADSIDDVLTAPSCQGDAPLQLWSRELLFSSPARAHWVRPDLADPIDAQAAAAN